MKTEFNETARNHYNVALKNFFNVNDPAKALPDQVYKTLLDMKNEKELQKGFKTIDEFVEAFDGEFTEEIKIARAYKMGGDAEKKEEPKKEEKPKAATKEKKPAAKKTGTKKTAAKKSDVVVVVSEEKISKYVEAEKGGNKKTKIIDSAGEANKLLEGKQGGSPDPDTDKKKELSNVDILNEAIKTAETLEDFNNLSKAIGDSKLVLIHKPTNLAATFTESGISKKRNNQPLLYFDLADGRKIKSVVSALRRYMRVGEAKEAKTVKA